MNRKCYRIVFNEKRGQWMAVAESAMNDGKTAGTASGEGARSSIRAGLRMIRFSLLLALGLAAILPRGADAQAVAYKAAPARQQATILNAGNGVPLVNIQTPNASGLSHNSYSRFDVQSQGLILNNARGKVATQLGGWVQGNPWLAAGTARIILNEVVSSTPSLLGGIIEVAGDKAQVIIANPAGVTCAGCGFLNANRATLTTGAPILDNGRLDGYRVEGGAIRIEGAGLDASQTGYTELIARAVEINAGVWAQQIKVTAGANRIDAENTQATPITGATPAPALAIDVAQLGGMYARQIHLIGTEAGVGVRNAGTIAASAGEVVVTADGRLVNRGVLIGAEARLDAERIDNSGTLAGEDRLAIASRDGIDNSGLLHAGQELKLETGGRLVNRQGTLDAQRLEIRAESLDNQGGTLRQSGAQALALTAARLDNAAGARIGNAVPPGDGQTGQDHDAGGDSGKDRPSAPEDGLNVPASAGNGELGVLPAAPAVPTVPLQLADGLIAVRGELANSGAIVASGALTLSASENLANAGTLTLDRLDASGDELRNSGTLTAGSARINAIALDNSGGTLEITRDLEITARDLINVAGTLHYTASDAFTLALAGRLDNRQGRIASNNLDLALSAASLDNSEGTIAHAGHGAFALDAAAIANRDGRIESQGAMRLNAETLDNAGGRIGAGETLTVGTSGPLDNRGGVLTAGSLDLGVGGRLDNRDGGQIVSDSTLVLDTRGALDNAGGTLASQQALTVAAGSDLANAGGQIAAGTDLHLTAQGALDNRQGRIEAAASLALDSHGLSNRDGTVFGQTLVIDTHGQQLDNTQGTLAAEEALSADSGALDNTAGLIQAGEALRLDTHGNTLSNRNTLDNTSARGIHGQESVTLVAGTVDNAAGQISAGQVLALTAGALDNQGGQITGNSAGAFKLSGLLDNRGGLLAVAEALTVTADSVDNRNAGQVIANDKLTLATRGVLDNAGGTLASQQALTVTAGSDLANAGGQIVAGSDLLVTAQGALDNTQGALGAVAGRLGIAIDGRLDNTQGRIEAASDIAIDSQELNNAGGAVFGQTLEIDTHGQRLDNTQGTLAAEEALSADSGALDNTGGLIQAGGALRLDTHGNTLTNRNTLGTDQTARGIRGQDSVTLAAGTVDNAAGQISAGKAVALTADALDNQDGQITANGIGTFRVGGQLDNRGGLLASAEALAITADSLDNRDAGQVISNDALTLGTDKSLDNAGGTLASQQALTVTVGSDLANAGGQIVAGTDLLVTAQGAVDNAQGTLGAVAGRLDLTAAGALNNSQGRIEAAARLDLDSHGLNNSEGTVFGQTLAIDTHGQRLDNIQGTLAAEEALSADSGALDNTGGLIQAGGALRLDTHGNTLTNRNTLGTDQAARGIRGLGAVTLRAGALDNAAGVIGAGEALILTLTAGTLDNRGGDIQAGGDLSAEATVSLDNSGGLMRSNATLTIVTAELDNTATNQEGKGIEANAIDIAARRIDNRGGALRADSALVLTSGGTLDNAGGLISSKDTLAIRDTQAATAATERTLVIDNGSGTLIAGQYLAIDAASLTSNGTILSHRDLSLDTVADIVNDGQLSAAGDLHLGTAGALTNAGLLRAGDTLSLQARSITNTADGALAGESVDIDAATLSNRGLIDGGEVRIDVDVLDNLGGGRLYGDHLAIAAGTLVNRPEEGIAPVIAARERLDLGVGTLENRDGALIFSAGDLSIGGTLDEAGHAIGQAAAIDNASATIEALGDLAIDTARLSNRKSVFEIDSEPATTTELPTGRALLDYAPGLKFYWMIGESSAWTWRNSIRERYLDVIAGLLGGGLDAATRTRLADAVNAQPIMTLADSHTIWSVLIDALAAEQPEAIDAMAQTLAAQGVSNVAYRQICDDLGDDCSYVTNVATSTVDTARDVVTADSPAAVLRAGGDAAIRATALENRYSLIESGGDMVLSGATLSNVGAELYLYTDTSTTAHQWHWGWDNSDQGSTTTAASTQRLIGSVPAIISAGGTLSGSFSERIDNLTIRQNAAPVVGATGSAPAATGAGPAAPAAAGANTAARIDGGTLDRAAAAATADTTADTAATPVRTAQTVPGGTASVPAGTGARLIQIPAADGNGPAGLIATVIPALALPANRLYHIDPGSTVGVLIETDPQFASYRQWLGSDYLLNALDPATTQKRLGDGFYEQRLIGEQIAQLTGRRFLEGYANDEEQYRALMNAGLTYAREWQLIPGVALTDAQMAQLTSDIVWLVEQEVTLADGSTQRVLVPQVYARVRDDDLAPDGALIAARDIALDTAGDLTTSGTIAGRQVVLLTAENLAVLRGRVSGQDVLAQANNDLTVLGGSIEAERTLIARAGNDLTVQSSTVDRGYTPPEGTAVHAAVQKTVIDRVAGLYVTGEGGTLIAAAGHDLTLLAAALINAAPTAAGTGSTTNPANDANPAATLLTAGNNLSLGTLLESSHAETHSKGNRWHETTAVEVGSTVFTAGDLSLAAGHDLSARAAAVTATGSLAAHAGNDLTITTGEAHLETETWHKSTKSGLLSKKTRERLDTLDQTTAISSLFSGDTVTLSAGHDLTIQGSAVVATNELTAVAGNDLVIETATETHAETHYQKTSQSGLFGSGGIGFTLGSRMLSADLQSEGVTALASTLGSVEGDLTLIAGHTYRQTGSDLLAPQGDIGVLAQSITIEEARETTRTSYETRAKQSGLSIALGSPAISAIQGIGQLADAAGDTQDSRMQALAAASAGLAAYQGYQATMADPVGGLNLSISLGSSKSQSQSTWTSDTAAGSTLAGGGDITLIATGGGENSDLGVQGSRLLAGKNLTLLADDEIILAAAANTARQQSRNQSNSASLGFSIGASGLLFNVSASQGRGQADGDDLAWTNSQLQAGETLTLQSGGDTTLKGAVAGGKTIVADIGGHLVLESLQDTSTYDSQQKSAGFSLSIGAGRVGGSLSASQSQIESDYASVAEQTGLLAGDGGFTIKVQGDTTLKGAVIASTQAAIDENKNSFDTGGALTLTDLENKAEYEAQGASLSLGAGASFDGKFIPQGTSAGLGEDKGHASSATKAGISEIAGNTGTRTGDPQTGIEKIFDAEKVQKEIDAQAKIAQAFGQQASQAVGDYASGQLRDAQTLRLQAEQESDPARAGELLAQADEIESQWGETGRLRIAAHTVIGGLTGGASGAIGSLAGTLTAPAIAGQLREAGLDGPLATTLTALASTAAGALAGGSPGAAAALDEVSNNYLTHEQKDARDKALTQCKTENECQKIRDTYQAISDYQDQIAIQVIDAARNCVGMVECAYAQSQLKAISKEIHDAKNGGEVQANMYPQWAEIGYALEEVERRYTSAECDASPACVNARTAGTLVAGVGVVGGLYKLATFCLTQPATCNAVGIEIANLVGAEALGPTSIGIASTGIATVTATGVKITKVADSAKDAASVVAEAHPLQGMTVSEVVQQANTLGLSTPRDNLLLWSGFGKDGPAISQAYAAKHGGMTLEMTSGGTWLTQMDLYGVNSPFTSSEADMIWAKTSELLVGQANGQVRAVLGNVRPASIYMTREILGVSLNPSITGLDWLYLQPAHVTKIVTP
jgi:filamentous hemagglutinin